MGTSSEKAMPRQAVILFSDIVHSPVFSDTLGLVDYDMFIEEFQKTMFDAKKRVFKNTKQFHGILYPILVHEIVNFPVNFLQG